MTKDEELITRLGSPAYWMSGSGEGHEGENNAPYEAAKRLAELEAENERLADENRRLKSRIGFAAEIGKAMSGQK